MMRYGMANCDSRRKTRFVTMCHSLAAVSAAAEGNIARSAVSAVLAISSGTCEPDITYAGYSIAAVALALEGRLLGAAGYAAEALKLYDLATPLLAFHFGLMSFDAADEPAASRIASGALSLSYAL